MKETGEP